MTPDTRPPRRWWHLRWWDVLGAGSIVGLYLVVNLPLVCGPSPESRAGAAAWALQQVRGQLEVWREIHGDVPRTPAAWRDFIAVSRRPALPLKNAVTGIADVRLIETGPGRLSANGGWVYAFDSGRFRLDVDGSTPDGTRWSDL